ncbi:MAG: heme-binding domain-containing protein [Chitinophagaceae bacterium]
MKKIFYAVIILLLVIQFIRPEKNIAAGKSPNHISSQFPVPENVEAILVKACNDCHSNNTVYPWYSYIQPVAFWLNDHIKDGKKHLNFDEFTTYRAAKQFHKLEEVEGEVNEGEMPLESYTLIHGNAKLTDEEKKTLINWSLAVRDSLKARYPADSLVMPKRK